MKRIATIVTLFTFILTLTACAGIGAASKTEASGNTDKPTSIETDSTVIGNTQATTSNTHSTAVAEATTSKTDSTAVARATKEPAAGLGKSSGVVAKSNNVISSQDNGKVMTELDKELDSLFSSIDKLEDVDDNDLNLN
jgi:hypothetical protein